MRDMISVKNAHRLTLLSTVKIGWIKQIGWSEDGTILGVAAGESIALFAGEFGSKPTEILEGHSGPVNAIAFSPTQDILASVSADMILRLWDISDLSNSVELIASLEGHKDSIHDVEFSPDGLVIATSSGDGIIYLWDVEDQNRRAILEGHQGEATSLGFALGGNILVSGGRDNKVLLWDVGAETRGTIIGEHDDWITEVQISPPGTMIASASKDATVRLWDALSGELYAILQAHPPGAQGISFSPDGTLLATGGRDHLIRLWYIQKAISDGAAERRKALITLDGHEKPVMSVAFNPTGTLLASGGGDHTLCLWAVGEGEDIEMRTTAEMYQVGSTSILRKQPE